MHVDLIERYTEDTGPIFFFSDQSDQDVLETLSPTVKNKNVLHRSKK